MGQTTCIGIGGDPINGTNFIDCLEVFLADPQTEAIVMIGEIGGTAEEEAAQFIKDFEDEKPIVSFIAGRTAPPGDAWATPEPSFLVEKALLRIKLKLRSAGIHVAESPAAMGSTMVQAMRG